MLSWPLWPIWDLAYAGKQPPVASNAEGQWQIIERIGKGFVAAEKKPADLPAPKKNLSKAEQLENFDILWEAIDQALFVLRPQEDRLAEDQETLSFPRQDCDQRRRVLPRAL